MFEKQPEPTEAELAEAQKINEKVNSGEIKTEWASDAPKYLEHEQIEWMELVDRGYLTEPDLLGLPSDKSPDDIKKIIEQGDLPESPENAIEKAESLIINIFERNLMFHSMYYYGGTSSDFTYDKLLNAVSRGLVSDHHDKVEPRRRDVTGSSHQPFNCISVFDPTPYADNAKMMLKGRQLILGYHVMPWGDNNYRLHGKDDEPIFIRDEETDLLVRDHQMRDHIDRLVDINPSNEKDKYIEYLRKHSTVGFPLSRGVAQKKELSQFMDQAIQSRGMFIPFDKPKEVPYDGESLVYFKKKGDAPINDEQDVDVLTRELISSGGKTANIVIKMNPQVRRYKVIPCQGQMYESLVTGSVQPWEIVGIIVRDRINGWEVDYEFNQKEEKRKRKGYSWTLHTEAKLKEWEEEVPALTEEEIMQVKTTILSEIQQKIDSKRDMVIEVCKKVGLPAYNQDGDLLWPKKMSHEDVEKSITKN
ncbi:MAG: hypothetical protein AAB446_02330 [Patescibacteria group bacterium]